MRRLPRNPPALEVNFRKTDLSSSASRVSGGLGSKGLDSPNSDDAGEAQGFQELVKFSRKFRV